MQVGFDKKKELLTQSVLEYKVDQITSSANETCHADPLNKVINVASLIWD